MEPGWVSGEILVLLWPARAAHAYPVSLPLPRVHAAEHNANLVTHLGGGGGALVYRRWHLQHTAKDRLRWYRLQNCSFSGNLGLPPNGGGSESWSIGVVPSTDVQPLSCGAKERNNGCRSMDWAFAIRYRQSAVDRPPGLRLRGRGSRGGGSGVGRMYIIRSGHWRLETRTGGNLRPAQTDHGAVGVDRGG